MNLSRMVSTFILLFSFLTSALFAYAQVMSSTNYKIDFDSVNVGGVMSSSPNYMLEDTIGEIATGYSNSTNYFMHAGFQQVDTYFIDSTISTTDVVLTPTLSSSNTFATGNTSVLITTNFPGGYNLQVVDQTALDPLLVSATGDTFTDYVPATSDPDYSFSAPSTQKIFGFSLDGIDIDNRFKSSGTSCNTGSTDGSLTCWEGISQTPKTIASRSTPNYTGNPLSLNGTTTYFDFRAEIGSNIVAQAGTYTGSITLLVIPQF